MLYCQSITISEMEMSDIALSLVSRDWADGPSQLYSEIPPSSDIISGLLLQNTVRIPSGSDLLGMS